MNATQSLASLIEKSLTTVARKSTGQNQWGASHVAAWNKPHPVASMVRSLAKYADDYAERYESTLGSDYVLGKAWLEMAKGTLTLLNGELGGLDGGTMDSLIRDMMRAAGFTEDEIDG
jgi:hypothetical protein